MTTLDSMKHAARILAGAALLVATGCASTLVTQDHVHHAGVLSKFTYAAADRDMTTVIIGNPFEAEKAAVETTITDAMQGNHHGPSTNFTTRPSENARPLFRVVMMFDPPPTMNSSRLCQEQPGAPDPATASRDRPGAADRLLRRGRVAVRGLRGHAASAIGGQSVDPTYGRIDHVAVDPAEGPVRRHELSAAELHLIPVRD